MAKRWYIIHAYSNFETKVAESIREQAKHRHLDHLFEEIIVPTEKLVEVRHGQRHATERKFFPGYVLAKVEARLARAREGGIPPRQGVQVLITSASVILLASRVNRCLRQSWQTAKVTLRSPQTKPLEGLRSPPPLRPVESRSLSGTLTAPGFNHPHLDLVRSIGVCSASPPTPYSQAGVLF
jgi:hypothetical protein